jgi:hypothetical protein
LFGNKGYGVFRYNETTNGLEPVSTHKYEHMTLNNFLAINKDSSNNHSFWNELRIDKVHFGNFLSALQCQEWFPE